MDDGFQLAESLCERMCHDLAGLTGTLGSLLDLAAEAPDDATEALALARDSARALSARLRLLRAAWSGLGTPLDRATLRAMVPGLPGTERLTVDAEGLSGALPAPVGRVVLCLLIVAAQSLPRGGRIELLGDGGASLVLVLSGRGAAWPEGFAGWAADAGAARAAALVASARNLAPPVAAVLAQQAGVRLSWLMAGPERDAPPPLLLDWAPQPTRL